jgi:hypothetical protein
MFNDTSVSVTVLRRPSAVTSWRDVSAILADDLGFSALQ